MKRLPEKSQRVVRNYFVDEGGDDTLFSSHGTVLIDTPGCSRFFILGLLDIKDPVVLGKEFLHLRQNLLADPYFSRVPSMRPERRKTAIAFHANADVPEVRREVFSLLQKTPGLRFFSIVSDKTQVIKYVQQRNAHDPTYRYKQNELYDLLVRRLFKELLHKDAGYEILFSKRGTSDRTLALKNALETARKRFCESREIPTDATILVKAGSPPQHPGLQAVDYFIWALQRLYEKKEDRYVEYLRPSFKLVIDIDDTRSKGYGVYYTKSNPIDSKAIAWRK